MVADDLVVDLLHQRPHHRRAGVGAEDLRLEERAQVGRVDPEHAAPAYEMTPLISPRMSGSLRIAAAVSRVASGVKQTRCIHHAPPAMLNATAATKNSMPARVRSMAAESGKSAG